MPKMPPAPEIWDFKVPGLVSIEPVKKDDSAALLMNFSSVAEAVNFIAENHFIAKKQDAEMFCECEVRNEKAFAYFGSQTVSNSYDLLSLLYFNIKRDEHVPSLLIQDWKFRVLAGRCPIT